MGWRSTRSISRINWLFLRLFCCVTNLERLRWGLYVLAQTNLEISSTRKLSKNFTFKMHDWKWIQSCVHIAMTKLTVLVSTTTPNHTFVVQYQTRRFSDCNIYNFVGYSYYFLWQDYLSALLTLTPYKQFSVVAYTSWSASCNHFTDKNVLKHIH